MNRGQRRHASVDNGIRIIFSRPGQARWGVCYDDSGAARTEARAVDNVELTSADSES